MSRYMFPPDAGAMYGCMSSGVAGDSGPAVHPWVKLIYECFRRLWPYGLAPRREFSAGGEGELPNVYVP